ncbi:hypothetical protein CJP74_01700 [Psittacicella melopsittaci]|uniref:Beta-lactamase n=1 Tax=Psittacicella melopsittaci TaxID=2028576 RepID=A0A3A1Y830_9GAMM|nr:tetratricopeptide repeat protein [Psittacicella melopsittaci]RIY33466.1 hypothetical protein CJP74_01700 [Psittacicella melopsittaci]
MRIFLLFCFGLVAFSNAQANTYSISSNNQKQTISWSSQAKAQTQTNQPAQAPTSTNQTKNDYNLGVKAYNAKDYMTARTYFFRASKQGSIGAKRYLGLMYLNGQGVTRNLTKSFNYFSAAAKGNDAVALYYVGRAYEYGQGVSRNLNQAKSHYQKSAQLGNNLASQAVLRLGQQK